MVTESKVNRLHSSTRVLGAKASNHTLLFMRFNSVFLVTITLVNKLVTLVRMRRTRWQYAPSLIDIAITQPYAKNSKSSSKEEQKDCKSQKNKMFDAVSFIMIGKLHT